MSFTLYESWHEEGNTAKVQRHHEIEEQLNA